ncbi:MULTISPECIES: MaoC family dehydratase N-terminal domain-containing protein [Rhodococcus]|uniref:MaoC family dehydratase N-terminal domain-containing protein n=1 Tax=Rhodococcus oxybenzonivorans TaxID=1990687 RepID=A0AAE4V588_9NOCA|nr:MULTISPECIES: MaoC family dehydratase N-terminal domain-containing protein [Rhodococcus]MDV7241548.1 MaoC family dehydratase N-terminal domain-containing protein [Rhodococcus oxybenzonivorans]MDV7269145.1 MaoC family dehydratase N-terminal domain-containing protein [Rhodococcus oxybenzonivorans]MDV7273919.1 MaoC family dehydratase N-terminal domain-containing protein [Rhodococcus oxybenzonivorans]MDV7333829.1 MaoC family dehydratase N-terminal domain-containing protein [Rhodococcus oxybenzon
MTDSHPPGVVDRVEYDIERGKIREFTRATFVTDPVHTDPTAARDAGFGDVPATLTHTVVAGHQRDQRAFVDALGLALERVVVGSVTWTYLRPLTAGDHVVGTRRVVDDVRREGKRGGTMRLVTLETEYVDANGEPVVRLEEVLIERGEQR